MTLHLSNFVIFVIGAFIGALLGRLFTFGLMAFGFILMMLL